LFIILIILIAIIITIDGGKVLKYLGGTTKKVKIIDDYEELRKLIILENPSYIHINGLGGSGKTAISKKLEGLGYSTIHLDEIIREKIAKNHPEGDNVFQLYRKGEYPKEKGYFIKLINEIIGKEKLQTKIGEMDEKILDEIFEGVSYMFIYVEPYDIISYMNSMLKRFDNDMKKGTKTLEYIHKGITPDIVEEYKNVGLKSVKLYEYIKGIAEERFEKIQGNKELYKKYNYIVLRNKITI